MDRCAQLVLHSLRNVQPVLLVVQEMAESAVVLPRVADDASGSIQYSLELAHRTDAGNVLVHRRMSDVSVVKGS